MAYRPQSVTAHHVEFPCSVEFILERRGTGGSVPTAPTTSQKFVMIKRRIVGEETIFKNHHRRWGQSLARLASRLYAFATNLHESCGLGNVLASRSQSQRYD